MCWKYIAFDKAHIADCFPHTDVEKMFRVMRITDVCKMRKFLKKATVKCAKLSIFAESLRKIS